MDIKLRSLICLGLNEQAIHLWLESLASNEEVVKKYYQPSSFLGSPGWVQVIFSFLIIRKSQLTNYALTTATGHNSNEISQFPDKMRAPATVKILFQPQP